MVQVPLIAKLFFFQRKIGLILLDSPKHFAKDSERFGKTKKYKKDEKKTKKTRKGMKRLERARKRLVKNRKVCNFQL